MAVFSAAKEKIKNANDEELDAIIASFKELIKQVKNLKASMANSNTD
ncbi:hypothetical protein [Mycoplasmopsis iners]|nr:hypothetical protein [Mycoplasmopsis iners]